MELGWEFAESSRGLLVQSMQLGLNLDLQEGKELGCFFLAKLLHAEKKSTW